MPRTIDPERLAQRRAHILAAAYRSFATSGYDGTSTAAICREARISSGTFFHYFPTKLDALVMLLTANLESTAQHLERIGEFDHGLTAILDHVRELERERATPHAVGFAAAVSGVGHLPRVAELVDANARQLRTFVTDRLHEAAASLEVRTDVPPAVLARWTQWLLDGASKEPTGDALPPGSLVQAVQALLERR